MATKKKAPAPHIQIGRARVTDVVVKMYVGKKTAKALQYLGADTGVIKITEQAFLSHFYPTEVSGEVQVMNVPEFVYAEPPINVLDKAKEIIYGDREEAYGNPRFNLDTIAQFWTVYLHRLFASWGIEGAKLSGEDVAQLMILLKTARLIHNPTHVDSLVDQAGYAALQHRIADLPKDIR